MADANWIQVEIAMKTFRRKLVISRFDSVRQRQHLIIINETDNGAISWVDKLQPTVLAFIDLRQNNQLILIDSRS